MEKNSNKPSGTGTREWSDVSHNIGIGCSHDCLYCYAADFALSKNQIKNRIDWANEKLTPRKIPTKDGVVMFPTAHDISPYYLEACIKTLREMFEAGREVLIVTKAHASSIKRICDEFEDYKANILIRITIGSMDAGITEFWEPGAPSPVERLVALGYAYLRGFKTSVSMEPILHGTDDAINTYRIIEPFVTEKIWIGKMNNPTKRVDTTKPDNIAAVKVILNLQSDVEIMKLYNELKDEPKVEWKDSIKQIVTKKTKK